MIVPNAGDISTLSQVARRISRAFSAGQQSTPHEFQDVEIQTNGLARALKQLADTLHAKTNRGRVRDAADHVQDGIAVVLNSCKRTLDDLESLVDQHQVTRKHRTVGGFAIERSWSDMVLSEYAKMAWTTDGGDLHCLKDLLEMHTSSVALLLQALQRLVVLTIMSYSTDVE
jgi:hypothetical protein